MDDPARTRDALEVKTVGQFLWSFPQSLTAADLDRRDGHGHLIDQICLEELADSGDPTPDPHVPAVGCLEGNGERLVWGRVEEVKRGVALGERWSRVMGQDEDWRVERRLVTPPPSQSWSSHGPRWGPNLFRPMISAPMFRA